MPASRQAMRSEKGKGKTTVREQHLKVSPESEFWKRQRAWMMFEALLPGVMYLEVSPPTPTSQPNSSVPPASTDVPSPTFVTEPRGDEHKLGNSDSKEEGEYESKGEAFD
ncbi:unnamed protein product [Ilex paraguariensis]|uniref:Uncharacterized protein n=1 Tax=Ilex paraguariensis TaxID=185542 RepID=A0ABC8RN67_9AQUA